MSDETGPEAPPAPLPEERTVGDMVAGAVEAAAKPIARMLGRKHCAGCEGRKRKLKSTVDRAVNRIRIGKRPR